MIYHAPLSSADVCAILDRMEDGEPLKEIVEPKLVEPIMRWLGACTGREQ